MHFRRGLSLVLLTFFPLASAEPSGAPVWTNSEAVAKERPDFLIHDDIELLGGTGNGGKLPEIPKGTLDLQAHGNPKHFRNIWIVER